MRLIEQYEQAVLRSDIVDDPLQRLLFNDMQRVATELEKPRRSWLGLRRNPPAQGLYLYGTVGVGKTYLMDLFYEFVAEKQKLRFHFHHFMQQIDAQLRRVQGQKNPLRYIVADLAKSTRLLCLDEFLVHDVADAMILAELLRCFFEHGMVLVTTSNTRPDDLYLNGVHRERFLPAIEWIKQYCQVRLLREDKDYRLGRAPMHQSYLFPLGETTHALLLQQFNAMGQHVQHHAELTLQNRQVLTVAYGERAVWFDFNSLCNMPRSQLDYLEIARRFDTVFVSNIPILKPDDTVHVILFIHLVDVMYDQGVHLIISAAAPAKNLYESGPMAKSFQRTLSRLEEMQSADYLHRHSHREGPSLHKTELRP